MISKDLIAPCGMNCALCIAYLREKNKCPGCHNLDSKKHRTSCVNCIIKNCEVIKNSRIKFCYVCDKFPCKRLKNLDKRYRTKYEMSMIENLTYIKKYGIEKFVENEKRRWVKDNKIYCVHKKEYRDFPKR